MRSNKWDCRGIHYQWLCDIVLTPIDEFCQWFCKFFIALVDTKAFYILIIAKLYIGGIIDNYFALAIEDRCFRQFFIDAFLLRLPLAISSSSPSPPSLWPSHPSILWTKEADLWFLILIRSFPKWGAKTIINLDLTVLELAALSTRTKVFKTVGAALQSYKYGFHLYWPTFQHQRFSFTAHLDHSFQHPAFAFVGAPPPGRVGPFCKSRIPGPPIRIWLHLIFQWYLF